MIASSTRGTEADAGARPWLVAALGLFLIGAGLLAWRTPMFEAPDENSHAEYAGLVLARQRLPLVLGTAEQTGEPRWAQAALGHHPPLYYAVLASILLLRSEPAVGAWEEKEKETRDAHEIHPCGDSEGGKGRGGQLCPGHLCMAGWR